jgi:hypothetical protein
MVRNQQGRPRRHPGHRPLAGPERKYSWVGVAPIRQTKKTLAMAEHDYSQRQIQIEQPGRVLLAMLDDLPHKELGPATSDEPFGTRNTRRDRHRSGSRRGYWHPSETIRHPRRCVLAAGERRGRKRQPKLVPGFGAAPPPYGSIPAGAIQEPHLVFPTPAWAKEHAALLRVLHVRVM